MNTRVCITCQRPSRLAAIDGGQCLACAMGWAGDVTKPCYMCGLTGGVHQSFCSEAPREPSKAHLAARVVELETALRDLLPWLESADMVRCNGRNREEAWVAARRVLGDRSGAAEDPEPHEQADRGE